MNRQELKKRADFLNQAEARYRGCWKVGNKLLNKCITCGKIGEVGKVIQGGHFIPRGCESTRYDTYCIWGQCTRCNGYKSGAYIEYSHYMLKNHPEEYERLINAYQDWKVSPRPIPISELRTIYNDKLDLVRQIEKNKGIKIAPVSWQLEIKGV